MLDQQNLGQILPGKIIGQRSNAISDHDARKSAARVFRDLLRGGQRLKARLVPLGVALFGDEQDLHRFPLPYSTRASCLSFSMSFAAASFGVPVMNSVFLVFCGT